MLTAQECAALAALYDDDACFRGTVVMSRHGFGRGEYEYFAYPLPPLVAALREAAYPELAVVANRWQSTLASELTYPPTLGIIFHDAS